MKFKSLCAKKIQRSFYRYQKLKKLKKIYKSIFKIQNLWKCRCVKKNYKKTLNKISLLQKFFRRRILKKNFGMLLKRLRKQQNSALKIQKYYKMYYQKNKLKRIVKSVRLIKKVFKGHLQRKEFGKLKFCFNLTVFLLIHKKIIFLIYFILINFIISLIIIKIFLKK